VQDVEAGQQQLLQRIAGLQADSVELHGQLLAERKAAAALREELSLTSTSRDTWRVSGHALFIVVASLWVWVASSCGKAVPRTAGASCHVSCCGSFGSLHAREQRLGSIRAVTQHL
jgi:hypothetical protein